MGWWRGIKKDEFSTKLKNYKAYHFNIFFQSSANGNCIAWGSGLRVGFIGGVNFHGSSKAVCIVSELSVGLSSIGSPSAP